MLTELWVRHVGPYVDPIWSSLRLWRTLALILVSAIVGLIIFRKGVITLIIRKEILDHDKNIFAKANSLLPERHWTDFCHILLLDHSYCANDMMQLDKTVDFYKEKQNRFIDNKLNLAVKDLILAIDKLRGFLSVRFSVFPEEQTGDNPRLCMQPEYNVDRSGTPDAAKMTKYDEWSHELEKIVNEARTTYDAYRSLVRKKLRI